jgi:hypothetical protein
MLSRTGGRSEQLTGRDGGGPREGGHMPPSLACCAIGWCSTGGAGGPTGLQGGVRGGRHPKMLTPSATHTEGGGAAAWFWTSAACAMSRRWSRGMDCLPEPPSWFVGGSWVQGSGAPTLTGSTGRCGSCCFASAVCVCVCLVCVYACVCICMCACMYMCVYVYACMCVRVCV